MQRETEREGGSHSDESTTGDEKGPRRPEMTRSRGPPCALLLLMLRGWVATTTRGSHWTDWGRKQRTRRSVKKKRAQEVLVRVSSAFAAADDGDDGDRDDGDGCVCFLSGEEVNKIKES